MSNGVGNLESLLTEAQDMLGNNSDQLPKVDLGMADGLLDSVDIQQLLLAANLDALDPAHSGDPIADYTFARNPDPLVQMVHEQQARKRDRDSVRVTKNKISEDTDLPDMMKDITGLDTWGDVGKTVSSSVLKGIGVLSGHAGISALTSGIADFGIDDDGITADEGVNIAEDIGLSVTGLTPFTALAEEIAASADVYDVNEGIINSLTDVYDAVVNGAHPETLSGWVAAGGTKAHRDRVQAADEVAQTRSDRYVSSNLQGKAYDPTAQDRADFAQGKLEGPVQDSGSDSGHESSGGRDKDGGSSRPDRDGPSGDSQGTGSANNER